MSTSELVPVPNLGKKSSKNDTIDQKGTDHVSTLNIKKDLNSKKELENGLINECNNVNGVKEAGMDTSAIDEKDIDMKDETSEKSVNEESTTDKRIEINGVSKESKVIVKVIDNDELDVNTDVEMDEDKLLNDAESIDSPSVNEDSLLNSDSDDIDEPVKTSVQNGDNETEKPENHLDNSNVLKVLQSENESTDNKQNNEVVKKATAENLYVEMEYKENVKSVIEIDEETDKSNIDKCVKEETVDEKNEFDENVPPLDEIVSETEEERHANEIVSETEDERRANRLKLQFDRVELLKDELRSEEATLTLLRKLFDSQRGKSGFKPSSKPQPSQVSNHVQTKPPAQVVQKPSLPPKQPPVQQKVPPSHGSSQPVQKYYIQVGNQLVPAPPPSNGSSNTVYQYANGTSHSYQPPPPPKPAVPPKQTPEQKKNAAKAALRRQLEQTLLQIPPPRPPPADWKAVPNVNSMDFMMLVGLDEVVDTILDMDNKPTLKKALENLTPYNPRICSQCKVDFSPCWKAAKNKNMDGFVLCERCALQNVKKELKAEHTSRLKSAFMKALKQEQEIEEKIKAGEDVNIPGISSEKQDSPSNHSPNPPQHPPQHQPSSNRNSSPKHIAVAVPPPAPSSGSHAPSPPERHHQPSSGHHRHHQVVQHYPHRTSLVQQLHHQHIQQQQLELEPSPRHSSRWHPYMSSSSSHHRDHHPVHHRSYVPGSSTSEVSPRQEYYVVHHPHQNVRYVSR